MNFNATVKKYINEKRLRSWDIPDIKIRFKKKMLKADGLSQNGRINNIKKTQLIFQNYEIVEIINISKDNKSNWKNKNEKMYIIDFPDGDHKLFYTLNDVKNAIQLKEKNKK